VTSSHPITPLPLEILIDTSANGNSDHIFVLEARNRAWPHFYFSIQILGASPFGPPLSCRAPGNVLPVPGTEPQGESRVGNAVDGSVPDYGRAGLIPELMFIALRNKGTELLSVWYSGL
jgi:hypothetical protein